FPNIYPLTNGNYVVANPLRSNGDEPFAGAVAWFDGSAPSIGTFDSVPALVGHANQRVGDGGVVALANGNYVVANQLWSDGTNQSAITWADGATGLAGVVSTANSLVGAGTAWALYNGNYVVQGTVWNPDTGQHMSTFTWADGSVGAVGAVSAADSLVGATTG